MRELKVFIVISFYFSGETLKLKEEIEKLKMENQTLKTRHHDRISSNRNDEKIKDPEQELQKAKQINDKYKKAYTEVVREYEKAVAKIENLEQTMAEDQLYRDKITREYTSVKEPLSALQNRYKAANDEMVKIEKELSESKSR
jgi:chromosome segregation ATPase